MRHLRFHTDRDVHGQSFLLQRVQPGLSGLMDGSLSTLAPIFAVVLATHRPLTAFYTGLATALGAGVSMAFSEGLSDTGDLTGRGNPLVRGAITGGDVHRRRLPHAPVSDWQLSRGDRGGSRGRRRRARHPRVASLHVLRNKLRPLVHLGRRGRSNHLGAQRRPRRRCRLSLCRQPGQSHRLDGGRAMRLTRPLNRDL